MTIHIALERGPGLSRLHQVLGFTLWLGCHRNTLVILEGWASQWALVVEPACQCRRHWRETWVQFLGQEDPLEEGMAVCSSILAWRSPWTEEPGRLQSVGLQRVGHDWSDLARMQAHLEGYFGKLFLSLSCCAGYQAKSFGRKTTAWKKRYRLKCVSVIELSDHFLPWHFNAYLKNTCNM